MRLFSRKKSTTPAPEEPSRPRAQGHLPPTTPKPSISSRHSSHTEQVTTPLYARFARPDSFENLSLRAKSGERAPSYAPTQQDLEGDAQRLGYDRPWARELMSALDSPEPNLTPALTGSTIRVVSGSKPADGRVSLDAVAAADPFMASKMQSIMRRVPSNARTPDATPKRSVTAPPTGSNPTSPPPRIPTAPPRSIPGPRSPPSSRPSFDDDESTSHSHQPRSYPVGSKRERGPPPVAGTPSAYAWKSGQSDDGHGGSSFYTGGSQTNPASNSNSFNGPPSAFTLPPGAAPPDPNTYRNPNTQGPSTLKKRTPSNPPTNRAPAPQGRRMSMDAGNARPLSGGPGTWGGSAIAGPGPVPGRERDRGANSTGPNSTGAPNSMIGAPSSTVNGANSYVTSPNTTYGDLSRAPTIRSVQPGEIFHHPGAAPMPMPVPQGAPAPYQAVIPPLPAKSSVVSSPVVSPTVKSPVISSSIKSMSPPPASIDPRQVTSIPPRQTSLPLPPQSSQPTISNQVPQSSMPAARSNQFAPQRQVVSPPQSQPVSQSSQPAQPSQPAPQPSQPARQSSQPAQPNQPTQPNQPPQLQPTQPTRPTPITTSPQPKKPTPGLPPGAAPASPASPTGTGFKHSPNSYGGPTFSAYGPTPGSAYGSYGPNGNVNGSGRVGSEGRGGNEGRVGGNEGRGGGNEASTIRTVAQGSQDVRLVGDARARQNSDARTRQNSDARARQNSDARARQNSEARTRQNSDANASQVSDARAATQLSMSDRTSQASDFRKSQASDVRTVQGRAGQLAESRASRSEARTSQSEARASQSEVRGSQLGEGRSSPTKPPIANQLTASPVGASPKSDSAWSRSVAIESSPSGHATPVTPSATLSAHGDPRNSTYSGASSVSVAPPSTPTPSSPTKSRVAPQSASSSPVRNRELPSRPGPSPLPPSSLREQSVPPRAPSSMSASSYRTALPLESEPGSEAPPPSKLALGSLTPINTTTRSGSPTPTASSAAPTSAMVTARMTPTTSAALSPATIPSLASTPQRGLGLPRSASPTPSASTTRMDDPPESDTESAYVKKRNLLVKTRKMDGASSFKSSEERSERPVSVVPPESPGPGLGLSGGEDPFARAPPTIVKSTKQVQEPASMRAMPLSPPLSSDDHDTQRAPSGLEAQDDKSPMTPALTDEAPDEAEELAEPESTTPPGSPRRPKFYPLDTHLNMPSLLAALLPHISFRDWNAINALNAGLRRQLEETRVLREEVLEYWLRGVGYARWKAHKREPLSLSLRDLNAYMRGVSIAVYRYSAIAESFLAIRAQQAQTKERVPGAASKGNLVRALASSCRAYTKVILRLREQADFMHPEGDFRSPLFKSGTAPLLRVFVPSKEGAWLSDVSVLDCEKELKRAGAMGVLRIGDVVWDAAVGDEGNAGRMVWDGNYLVDLDYTYSTTGELPKYINSLAFSPSYWHKIIRTSNSPLCHIDLTPYAAEIAANLQLVQDRVQTETPQGGRHTVVRWVHRSRFHTRPGMPIPGISPPAVVDRTWDGYIIVEVEGTNEGLADLQTRVGNAVRLFPAKTAGMEFGPPTGKSPFRLLRSASRPGEIWMRAVREKEKLM